MAANAADVALGAAFCDAVRQALLTEDVDLHLIRTLRARVGWEHEDFSKQVTCFSGRAAGIVALAAGRNSKIRDRTLSLRWKGQE